MSDCTNVVMRELLPDLAAGTLDAATRAHVEAHVAGCAECTSELETLHLVRSAFATAAPVSTARVVAALPKPPGAAPHRAAAASSPRALRWMDWRIAAALTMIAVGGLSVAVTQRREPTASNGRDSTLLTRVDSTIQPTVQQPAVVPNISDSATPKTPAVAPIVPRSSAVQLALDARGEGDLDDASFQALLGALDEIDRGPIAPSAEPDGSPVLPVIREGGR